MSSEAEIVTEMIDALKAQLEDPFCDDKEQAEALLASAQERLRLLGTTAQDGIPAADADGSRYTVNEAGFGEPDITTPNPGSAVLSPPAAKALPGVQAEMDRQKAANAVDSRPVDASDFDRVVQAAANLGISANVVHTLWAEIPLDRSHYFALRTSVMNYRLLQFVKEVESQIQRLTFEFAKVKKDNG